MLFKPRYEIRHLINRDGEPITEIIDRRLHSASRFLGLYTDDAAIAWLEQLRASCLQGSVS